MYKQNCNSQYIKLVIDYAENLLKNNVEVIYDLDHISLLTNKSIGDFLDINNYYKEIQISKRNGETRTLAIPDDNLKSVQKWILKSILEKMPISNSAKGFKKGLSIVENAKPHTNKDCVLSLDLKDFFPSITQGSVYFIFKEIGYTEEVSRLLTRLCTYQGQLPQGAPTSPYIANLVCRKLDIKLQEFACNQNIAYTRYADDLTFSANKELSEYIPRIKEIVIIQGFKVNDSKTRCRYRHQRQLVTGLVVNNEKVSIPRELKRKLRQEIHYCKKFGVHGHLYWGIKYYSNYKDYLLGMALYVKMVDKNLGKKLLEEIKSINWEY
ncbi:RNA-directed DNA polymerase [Neobacillus bataviensis]|uniref:RNA-directed DNA polymerase n=2 Tax=Neobacillus bataviensis TaxID=220685 RepID=A0A561CM27_9BACI|nr:RNA-directed DNA polymerase [Neobacillus bataviensis]